MKTILFFIESLDGGGAERALTLLVENLDRTKYDVNVVSETDNELFTQRIKACCEYKCFARKPKNRWNLLKKFWNMLIIKFSCTAPLPLVYRVLIGGHYDIEVAFCEGYATRLIANSPNKYSQKIAWIHTDVINNPWSETIYSRPDDEVECYKCFDTVCCVSQQVMQAASNKFGVEAKARVLYNPIDEKALVRLANEDLAIEPVEGLRIITAGRLVPQKAFDRLICIAKRLKDDNYRFEMLILGKGPEEENLTNLIQEYNVSDCVKLAGFIENPYNYIVKSDFFVCSSIAEGFSTIATECVLLNKPVITTDCSGMAELFGDLACGIICENNEDALCEAMKYVLNNPSCLAEFSENCEKRAEVFTLKNSIEQIEKMLNEVQK